MAAMFVFIHPRTSNLDKKFSNVRFDEKEIDN